MTSRIDNQSTTEISNLLDSFLRTWNDKDLEGFMENFHDDAEFTDVVSQTAIGKKAIKEQHQFAFNVVMKSKNELWNKKLHPTKHISKSGSIAMLNRFLF